MAKEQNKATSDFNEFESELIRSKAAALARRGLVPRSDVEDVEQDLAVALVIAQSKVTLDPERREGFAARVVGNAASNLVRSRFAAKRHPASRCSLDELVEKCEDILDRIEIEPSTQPTEELHLDFTELLSKLPDELRQLAESLKTKSVKALAEELGMPRSTLYSRLRVIRAVLERAGFRKFP